MKNTDRISTSLGYSSLLHLHLGKTQRDVLYLGYPFKVTAREYQILKLLCENRGKELTALQMASLLCGEMSEKNVVYHIFNVNRKSKELGGRELIKNKAKIGYFLNEEM
ncbi:MAG: winged helix-turn-helix domain-containing protein [Eubacteriales bacterium]